MSSFGNCIAFRFRRPPAWGRRPAIFLDRDGVINKRAVGEYITSWDEFQFLDGIIPVLREVSRFKLALIVVSNQAGVGKRLMGRTTLGHITARFVNGLVRAGVRISAAYYCPHTSNDGCQCRKPRPGMFLRAAYEWRVDLSRSVLVGDSPSDIEAGRAAGCRSILLDSQEGSATDLELAKGMAASPRAFTVRQVSDVPAQVAALLERYFCC